MIEQNEKFILFVFVVIILLATYLSGGVALPASAGFGGAVMILLGAWLKSGNIIVVGFVFIFASIAIWVSM